MTDKISNGNGNIEITKGKVAIGSGAILTVLYLLMNFAPLRVSANAERIDDNISKIELNINRIVECERNGDVIVEKCKNMEKTLDEIKADLKSLNEKIE